MYIYWLSSDSG